MRLGTKVAMVAKGEVCEEATWVGLVAVVMAMAREVGMKVDTLALVAKRAGSVRLPSDEIVARVYCLRQR